MDIDVFLTQRRPIRDTTAQNAFIKFDDMISKKFAKQLEGFSEEEYRQLENMKDLFEFLDAVEPDSEEEDVKPTKRTRKRYALKAAAAYLALTSYPGGPRALLQAQQQPLRRPTAKISLQHLNVRDGTRQSKSQYWAYLYELIHATENVAYLSRTKSRKLSPLRLSPGGSCPNALRE